MPPPQRHLSNGGAARPGAPPPRAATRSAASAQTLRARPSSGALSHADPTPVSPAPSGSLANSSFGISNGSIGGETPQRMASPTRHVSQSPAGGSSSGRNGVPSRGAGGDKCNVTVCVRIRPILASGLGTRREEEEGGSHMCVSADPQVRQVTIWDPADRARKEKKRVYGFDHVYPPEGQGSGQDTIYHDIGASTIVQAFKGYNTCIFAYGQTSSGKTYTMLGPDMQQPRNCDGALHRSTGLIPRICTDLFGTIASQIDMERVAAGGVSKSYRVECCFFEIYNEKVFDLLERDEDRRAYRVREHPRRGPYVDGLQRHTVRSYQEIERLLKRGAKSRHTAATLMNDHSSRSHAVCEIVLTCAQFDDGDLQETVSRMELVDLAGSERSDYAGTSGERLMEGSNINKSLLTLGNVIESLAQNSERRSKQAASRFVQYRDSTLTWLLREALGGNSKTFMVATLSPSVLNYEETHSTLKYADRAKKIQNTATINRDSKKAIIFNLRQEVNMLRAELERLQSGLPSRQCEDVETGTDGFVGSCDAATDGQPHWRHALSKQVSDSTHGDRSSILVSRCDPYLLQRKPLAALREPVVFWLESGATYLSCDDHTGKAVPRHLASRQKPLARSDHTIVLKKHQGVTPYHILIHREADAVTIDATCGAPYEGAAARSATAGSPARELDRPGPEEVLVDGVPLEPGTSERLACGAIITVGDYEFAYVDPSNIDEIVAFQRQCNRVERAKAARDKSMHAITRRVQRILADAGVQVSELPTEPKESGDFPGQTEVVRSSLGPRVLVWEPDGRDGEGGSWEQTQDAFLAEAAAVQVVDRKRAEEEISKRLSSMVSGHIAIKDIPTEAAATSRSGQGGEQRLVRSPRSGLKVVEWNERNASWERASGTAALMTARDIIDEQKASTAQQTIATGQQLERELEGKNRELLALREAEKGLEEQLATKDRLLLQHKDEAQTERSRLQEQHDAAIDDAERRCQTEKSIRVELEQTLEEVRYQVQQSEALHEMCIAAKDRAVSKMQAMQRENAGLDSELRDLRDDIQRAQREKATAEERCAGAQKRVADLEEMRRASGVSLLEEKVKTLSTELSSSQEQFEHVKSNLQTLSQDYAKVRKDAIDAGSRTSSLREALEKCEHQAAQLTAERDHSARQVDALQRKYEEARGAQQQLLQRQREQDGPQMRELQTLQKRFAAVEAQLEQSTSRGASSDKRSAELSAQRQHLQKQLKDTLEKYNASKRKSDELAQRAGDLTRRNDAMKDELVQAQAQLRVFKQARGGMDEKQECMQLSIQLGLAQQENSKLQAELRDHRRITRESLEGGQTKMRDDLTRLRDQLRESETKCLAMDAQLKDAKGRAERERMARQGQEEEVRYLQNELRLARQSGLPKEEAPKTRQTNPFGAGPDPTQPKQTPRTMGSMRAPRRAEPGYMKTTQTWTQRDACSSVASPPPPGRAEMRRGSSPTREATTTSLTHQQSSDTLRRSNSNRATPRGQRGGR